MASLITTTSEVTDLEPKNGSDFCLEELYAAIGCRMIEVVRLRDGSIMIADEEGMFSENAAVNLMATTLAGTPIVGNVVICDNNQLR